MARELVPESICPGGRERFHALWWGHGEGAVVVDAVEAAHDNPVPLGPFRRVGWVLVGSGLGGDVGGDGDPRAAEHLQGCAGGVAGRGGDRGFRDDDSASLRSMRFELPSDVVEERINPGVWGEGAWGAVRRGSGYGPCGAVVGGGWPHQMDEHDGVVADDAENVSQQQGFGFVLFEVSEPSGVGGGGGVGFGSDAETRGSPPRFVVLHLKLSERRVVRVLAAVLQDRKSVV